MVPHQSVGAVPVYWSGLSAQTKAFFDRTFCYYAASYPDSARVIEGMSRKRIGLVLASEETYPGLSLGIVHQVQEFFLLHALRVRRRGPGHRQQPRRGHA